MDLDDLLGDPVSCEEAAPAVQSEGMPNDLQVPRPRRLPANGPPPVRVHPVQLVHFRDPPPHVKPYVTNACYYANQISIISRCGTRSKRGIVVNDSTIYIMAHTSYVERTIPLTQLEAFYKQDVLTSKSFGMTKELQTEINLQLRDIPDLYFVLSEDKKKDLSTGRSYGEIIPSLETVLGGLLQSYDLDLVVCNLEDGESIQHLIKWTVTDTLLRRECSELLAYRTSLLAELKELAIREPKLITQRNEIEASGASQSTIRLLNEIQIVEGKKEKAKSLLQQTNKSLAECREKEHALRTSLEAKANERHTLASECFAARQGEMIVRQALEYELMKVAHESEIRRLKLLLAFLKPRAEQRRKSRMPSAMELQADAVELAGLKKRITARKEVTTGALTEAKCRLSEAKAALKQLTEEVEMLRQLPADKLIPDDFNYTMAPAFLPVQLPEEEERGGKHSQDYQQHSIHEVNQTTSGTVNVALPCNNRGGGKAAILSDDDDDIDLLPSKKQQASNVKPLITIDDDDL